MTQKFIVLLLVLFTLLSPALAQYQTGTDSDGFMHFPSYQYPYGGDATTFSAYCDRSETDVCPLGASFSADDGVVISICDSQQVAPSTRPTQDRLYYEWELAPRALLTNCDIGSTQDYIQLENANNGNQWSGGELLFYPQVQGSYLHVGMNYDKDALHQFHLKSSSSTPNNNLKNSADMGDVLVTHHSPEWLDGEDTRSRAFESETGVILNPYDDSSSLSDIVQSCNSDFKTCKIAKNLDFGTGYDTGKCTGKCGLGYNDNGIIDYEPDMEIIAGEQFSGDSFPTTISNKQFYICDDALPGTDGRRVYSPGNNYESDYFECNFGDWQQISPQTNCPDPNVGTARFGINSYDKGKAAFWGSNPSGTYVDEKTGCSYDHRSPETYSQWTDWGRRPAPFNGYSNPLEFTCNNGTTNDVTGYPNPFSNEYTESEKDYLLDAQYADSNGAEAYCDNRADWDFETVDESLPMTQFYIPLSAIPYGSEGAAFVSTNGNYKGIENWKFSDLYRAMVTYDGGSYDYMCEECEKQETWDNKSLRNTDEYAENDSANYIEAWTVDNVGSGIDGDVTSDYGFKVNSYGETTDNDIFPGGYAGDCQGTLTWQLEEESTGDNEWICSNELPLKQQIFVPTFDYPTDKEMVTVGFHMLPYLFNTSTTIPLGQTRPGSFSQEVMSTFSKERKIKEFEAVCWWGKYGELKEANEGDTWFAIEYKNMPENPQNPIPVFGKLNKTVKQNKGLGGPSCRWVLHESRLTGALTNEIYTGGGTVTNVASNIGAIEENRTYTSNQINIQDQYADDYKMNSDTFRIVSEEWQNEAGYDRTAETTRNGYNYLNCLPNADHFHEGTNMC